MGQFEFPHNVVLALIPVFVAQIAPHDALSQPVPQGPDEVVVEDHAGVQSPREQPADTGQPSANPIQTCFDAIDKAEALSRELPPGLLLAIAKTESGRSVSGQFGPWPWTLNIAGEGRYFDTRADAVSAAETALEAESPNVDLGCMQISETWHGSAFENLDAMIDPVENARYAADFLMGLHATHGTWRDAVAHYHSSNPARGFAYAERVLDNWRQDPEAAAFIEVDESLADVPRLAETLEGLPQITEIEAEYFVTAVISERYEVASAFAVKDADGRLYVSLNDLAEVPFEEQFELPLVVYDDTVMIDLSDGDQFDTSFEDEAFRLEIVARGELFPSRVSESSATIRPEEITPRSPGAHLNYTLNARGGSSREVGLSAVLDGMAYWDNKTLRGSILIDDEQSWQRRSSTLTIDNYKDKHQLILGDTTTPSASAWGRSYPIFGLNWGTSFALDPSFSTSPEYSIYGVTDVPAVARFLVDGEPVRETNIDPGPYEFSDLPFPDAFGDMTVKVEDVQGRTRRFKVPYIRISELYREGLHTYNYGVGVEKVASDHPLGGFGGLVGAATHRYGFSDSFTGEIHGEVSAGSIAVGVSGDFALLDKNRLVSATAAASFSEIGPGIQAKLSYGDIQRDLNAFFRGSLSLTSRDFHVGTHAPVDDRARSRINMRLSSSLAGVLPVSVNYSYTDTWDGSYQHRLSAGRTWTLSDGWSISTSGSVRMNSTESSGQIFFGFSKSFGDERPVRARISTSRSDGADRLSVSLRRPKRSGPGAGYYARTTGSQSAGSFDNVSFGVDGEAEKVNYSASGRWDGEQLTASGTLSGSIGYLDGQTFLASDLRSSYVLVSSGEASDLPILLNYNMVGETDSSGLLVSDGLTSFSRNRVEFRPEDLGFDYSISDVGQAQTIVPVSTGGYVVKFPINEQFPATVSLVDGDGAPLPAGTVIFNVETEETAGVTADGKVYLENVGDEHRLEADLGRFGSCEIVMNVSKKFKKFDEIGPFECE